MLPGTELVVAVITVTQDWNLTLIATDQWHQNVCIVSYVLISKHTSLIPRREAMNTLKPPLQCSSSPMLDNNESFCTEAPVGGVSEKLQNFRYLWTKHGYQIGSLISRPFLPPVFDCWHFFVILQVIKS